MIQRSPFGGTGHDSSRTIFGSACLKDKSQAEADPLLDLLQRHGVNHIDTAPSYGDAELRVGAWMRAHRGEFFLATKTDRATYQECREQFHRSLERLQTDHVDLLQWHNLTDVVARELVMRDGGALEWMVEARQKGLARFLGVTGHGHEAGKFHLESLERFRFDSVLLPYSYLLMQDALYAERFEALAGYCREREIAVQTIKSAARRLWGGRPRTHDTWYEPISDPEDLGAAVQWVLGRPGIFLVTAGDEQVLTATLEAAETFRSAPPDARMKEMLRRQEMEPLFT